MATYKVLQDIEAEDKLIGPLTLRQFIYALVGAFNGYLIFLVVTKGAPFMAAVFLPLMAACFFFAWPWTRDQPTEVWALAKLRFYVKPKKRIWNQTGIKELVTITAPKTIDDHQLTNGLSQTEVRSRLRTLAGTIDSRGWAIKHVNVNTYGQSPLLTSESISDRLVKASTLPQPAIPVEVQASDDMMDVENNPVAQKMDSMISASVKAHRQDIVDRMQGNTKAPVAPPAPARPVQAQPGAPQNSWFLREPNQISSSIPHNTVTFNTQVVAPGAEPAELPVAAANPTPAEESLIKQLDTSPALSPNTQGHLPVIEPPQVGPATTMPPVNLAPTTPQPTAHATRPAAMPPNVTRQPDAAILDLAHNDDLNVATIAREAYKRKGSSPQEGVIIFRR